MPRLRVLLAATFLVVSCAACSGKGTEATPSDSSQPSMSTPTSPTSSVPSALVSYTVDQRKAYGEAVAADVRFTDRNSRLLAKGKTTRQASRFYHRYSIDWATAWGNLAQLANNDVTIRGRTRVVWVRPITIKLTTRSPSVVVIRRCLDESKLVVTQNGKQRAQPQLKKHHVYRVRLEKRPNETWWRAGVARQGKSC